MIKEKIKWPTPMQAIKAKCLECMGFSASGVKECKGYNCVLYPYRFGKRNKKIMAANNMLGWGQHATFLNLKEAGKVLDGVVDTFSPKKAPKNRFEGNCCFSYYLAL